MFGFSWGEIGIILAVALIVIGPKDFPVAIRTVTGLIKKARAMAAEFQGHVDDMMREANIADVAPDFTRPTTIHRTLPAALAKTIDSDGLLRASIKDMDALMAKAASTDYTPPAEVVEAPPDAPAIIPPDAARKAPVPAIIPPGTKRWGY